MNQVMLVGYLAADPEVRTIKYGEGEFKAAVYRIAVNRWGSKKENQKADFIRCECYRGAAEFAEKYFRKGSHISVVGRLQTDSYTKEDGTTVYKTYVAVEKQQFEGGKKSDDAPAGGDAPKPAAQPQAQPQAAPEYDYGDSTPGFSELEDLEGELPF